LNDEEWVANMPEAHLEGYVQQDEMETADEEEEEDDNEEDDGAEENEDVQEEAD